MSERSATSLNAAEAQLRYAPRDKSILPHAGTALGESIGHDNVAWLACSGLPYSPKIALPSGMMLPRTLPSSLLLDCPATMRPARRENGSDCSHTRPGPVRVAR